MSHITIVDQPCGYGKSSCILESLDKRERYIAVVPYLSEVDRFVEKAREQSGFNLTAPSDKDGNKSRHCEKLLGEGKSIVCTHALFYKLGTLATQELSWKATAKFNGVDAPVITTRHLLDDHNLILDEVVDPFHKEPTVRRADFNDDYINDGLAVVHADGRVVPTDKWDRKFQRGSETFRPDLYQKAKSGGLYRVSEDLFVITVPVELLLRPKSVTVYTFLSEGSVLLQFLRKLQEDRPGELTLDVQKLDKAREAEWRADVASALLVQSIPGLEDAKWNYTAQLRNIKTPAQCAPVQHRLRQFRDTALRGVELDRVMLCCARELWYGSKTGQKPAAGRLARETRMFGRPQMTWGISEQTGIAEKQWSTTGVQFVPNTTRGTNAYVRCTHAVYLYDQNPKPELLTFLGLKQSSSTALAFADAYALTELVQWLFRSAIRVGGINGTQPAGEPRRRVTVYIPSKRMRNLLLNWLLTGKVSSAEPSQKKPQDAERLQMLQGKANCELIRGPELKH